LGSFMSGLLPGRWFGVRLAPALAASAFLLWVVQIGGERYSAGGIEQLSVGSPGWLVVLLISAALSSLAANLIFQIGANRDFG
jgi:hypothetical protein